MGSLAGAAHLLKNNAGVQWSTHAGQKPVVAKQVNSWFDLYFQYKYGPWKRVLAILYYY